MGKTNRLAHLYPGKEALESGTATLPGAEGTDKKATEKPVDVELKAKTPERKLKRSFDIPEAQDIILNKVRGMKAMETGEFVSLVSLLVEAIDLLGEKYKITK